LNVVKDNFVSNEIRNDRQIVDSRHGLKRIEGDINFELGYGYLDDFLEAALFGSWTTNVLKAGTTAKYFSIERAFNDVAQFMVFKGCMIDRLTLNVQPNAMITGSFGIVGKDVAVSGATVDAGGGITAAATNAPYDGFAGAISEGGGAVDNITQLTLELQNNLAPSFVVGLDTTPQILAGRSMLTGEVTAFFESATLFNKFLNETESSISFTLTGLGSAGDQTWLIPRVKYNAGNVNVQNADDGLLVTMPFQALRDSTEATNLKITRVP
jgi:hypothetical protein